MSCTGDHMRSDMISPYGELDIVRGILMVEFVNMNMDC